MKCQKFYSFIIFIFLLVSLCYQSCISTRYLPIKNIVRIYPPTDAVLLIDKVTEEMIYIGRLKVVPDDRSFIINTDKGIKSIIEEARKCGANYVYIKEMTITSTDFRYIRWDTTYGDGATIEAELYR